jgi:hypothetical protein
MKKLVLVCTVFLLSACQLATVPPTPAPTAPPQAEPPTAVVVPTTPPVEVTSAPTQAIAEVAPIPASPIEIGGVAYTAYQIAGDPFRFVCPDPCTLDLQYIYAEYAGFRLAHANLIELTGIDTLAELQPVDMHLDLQDSVCKDAPYGHAYIYTDRHQAFTCSEGPGYYPNLAEKIQNASRLDGQYFPLHEYMHTLFFGRLSASEGNFQDYKAAFMHDFVVPIPSYAIGLLDQAAFCTYRDIAPGDYGGFLINELCTRNGFQLKDLAPSLIALDQLVQSGGGKVSEAEYPHPLATIAQYRDILNNLLGSDTTPAFAAACWPPEFFGNSYTPAPGCAVSTEPAGTPTPLK